MTLRFGPPPPAVAPGPRSRTWLHVVLVLATLATLTLAGLGWATPQFAPDGSPDVPEGPLGLVLLGLPYALLVLLVLGAHEMGHYLACRYYGIPATLPFFIPGIPPLGSFGAVIRIRGIIPNRRALFDVAAAGPIAGFVVALPALLIGYAFAAPVPPEVAEAAGAQGFGHPVALMLVEGWFGGAGPRYTNSWLGAGWVGMFVTSLNLFPVGQLDGGHAAYAIGRRLHRRLAYLTLIALGSLLLWHVTQRQVPAYLLWFAILFWMRDRHPRLLDETSELGRGRVAVAWLLVAMFVVSFIPIPFVFST